MMDPVGKIKSLSPEHFSEICRICLSSEALRPIPETLIDNIEATDLFEYTIGVQFDKNDLMPLNICDKCLVTLHEMYKLKKQCLINELLFKTQIDYYKILQRKEQSSEMEIDYNIVKKEKEFEDDTIPVNGDIVNTVTTTSDEIKELNNVKLEPDDYDLTLHEEKEQKTEEEPEVREIVTTEHSIGTLKTEQSMINVTDTQNPITSVGIPNCTKETSNTIDTRTTFPITTPVIYNSNTGSNTSNVSKPLYIVNYPENPVTNVRIIPGTEVLATSQVYLVNYDGPDKPVALAPTFNIPQSQQQQPYKRIKPNPKIPCSVCSKLIGRLGMAVHLRTHESQRKNFQCDECPRSFISKGTLKLHKMRHTDTLPLRCSKCQKGFSAPSMLKYHEKICKKGKDTPKELVCKICGQTFLSQFSFRRHLRLHVERKEADEQELSEYFKDCPFSCQLCPRSYETEAYLNYHIKYSHSGASYLCTVCGKNLTSKCGLEKHMTTHTDEKPFTCEVCQQTFKSTFLLKSHMYKHTDERPFKCKICLKRFKLAKWLNNHLIVHTGDKPYQCTFCDKKFATNGNLRKHIATHTGEKRHFCSICNKGFYDKNMMTNHEAKHQTKAKKGRKKKAKDTD